MAVDGGIDINGEFVDDGSSFIGIVPTFITPSYLSRFRIYEKVELSGETGIFRFRCLLKDTASIPETTLVRMLRSWDCLYIHKQEMADYDGYLKDNLHTILASEGIDMDKRALLFTEICSELIHGVMEHSFKFSASTPAMSDNLKKMILKAISHMSGIDVIKGFANLIGHDYDTYTHSIRVGWLMAVFINVNPDLFQVARKPALEKLVVESMVMGFLHDLGKTKIPRQIINKKGLLTNLEYVAIQAHTAYSVSLLFNSSLPKYVMDGLLYHHENQDGSGYPCGLKGDDIPLFAKICHIADVFDAIALTPEHPYKSFKTPYQALTIMAGKNPNLDVLRQMEKEIWECSKVPVSVVVRNEKDPEIKLLKYELRMNKEAEKRVEVRGKLRDKGMAHCFDAELLKRFVLTLNSRDNFDFSNLFSDIESKDS